MTKPQTTPPTITFLALLLFTALPAFANITDQLVGYWPFDSDCLDYSGQNNNAAPANGQTHIAGIIGSGAIDLNSSRYVNLGSSADFNFGSTTDFTISIWVKSTGWSSDPTIISNKNWASGGNQGWASLPRVTAQT